MVTGEKSVPALRRAGGRAARRLVARAAQADWHRAEDGPGSLGHLRGQESIRVADLLPLRYERMSASPWTYFRGAAAVMAADLAGSPHSGLTVQMCGDAHVLNFGLWATPERNLAFALRDFDETLPGPFEWDVKRLATSLVIVARENGHADEVGLEAVRTCVRAYRDRMRRYAGSGPLAIWYDAIHVEELLGHFDEDVRGPARRMITKKAGKRGHEGAFARLVDVVDGQPRIREDAPRFTHVDERRRLEVVHEVFDQYAATLQDDRKVILSRFTYTDVARQVVGVGSVGMLVHLVLLTGPRDEPLFLQVKQAGPSVYEQFLGPSTYPNHAARVVNGQRLIQSASDMFAGWTSYRGTDFYVRQFRDMKVIPDTHVLRDVLADFARACGEALAKAHARSGDPVAIDGYLGRNDAFTGAMARFARTYADRNEADHADLVAAVAAGQMPRPV
ncbi:MAG: DUF2252 domain-containing protein [Actinomycetes bacterium]